MLKVDSVKPPKAAADPASLHKKMMQLLSSLWVTHAIGSFARMGLADAMEAGGDNAEALAKARGLVPVLIAVASAFAAWALLLPVVPTAVIDADQPASLAGLSTGVFMLATVLTQMLTPMPTLTQMPMLTPMRMQMPMQTQMPTAIPTRTVTQMQMRTQIQTQTVIQTAILTQIARQI